MRFRPLDSLSPRFGRALAGLQIACIRWRSLGFEIDPKYGFFFLYLGSSLMGAGIALHLIALRGGWSEWPFPFLLGLGAPGAGAALLGMTLQPSLRSRDANGRPELVTEARDRIERLGALAHRAEIEEAVRAPRRKSSPGRRL